jgi:hypothetical protein
MSQDPFQEKRHHPRVENSIPIKITAADADFVTESKNISCSGVYCKIEKFLEPMTKLQILLLLPMRKAGKVATKKISCGGVVVRTENILQEAGFNTAIFFNDIRSKDSRTLAEFVEGVRAQQKSPAKI